MQPIVVQDLVKETWRLFLDHGRAFLGGVLLWFVLLLLLHAVLGHLLGGAELFDAPALDPTGEAEGAAGQPIMAAWPPGMGPLLVLKFAEGLLLAAFSVAVHRLVLLREPFPALVALDVRGVRYALRMVAIVAAAMVPVVVLFTAAIFLSGLAALSVAILPAMLLILLVTCRLHPVLPAAALDQRYRFGEAWDRTRGQGWRLAGGVLMLVAPILIGGTILSALVGGRFEGVPILDQAAVAIAIAADLLEAALVAIYFSLTWRKLAGSPPAIVSTVA